MMQNQELNVRDNMTRTNRTRQWPKVADSDLMAVTTPRTLVVSAMLNRCFGKTTMIAAPALMLFYQGLP